MELGNTKKGIAGSTLKLIAIVTMLIDHIGATIVFKIVSRDYHFTDSEEIIYNIFRGIGRLAFPIFIFLMLEGFKYTRSRGKYLLRLLLFSAISEIPFDLAFNLARKDLKAGRIIELDYQNVFFTLAIGFVALMLIEAVKNTKLEIYTKVILIVSIAFLSAEGAELLGTDYGKWGVFAILAGYMAIKKPEISILFICAVLMLSNIYEACALIDVWFVSLYNGKRGLKIKWLFYFFYPAHLLVLALILYMTGLR